jgi:hypothetical protein
LVPTRKFFAPLGNENMVSKEGQHLTTTLKFPRSVRSNVSDARSLLHHDVTSYPLWKVDPTPSMQPICTADHGSRCSLSRQ